MYILGYLVGAPPERHEAEGEQRGEQEEEDLFVLSLFVILCGL